MQLTDDVIRGVIAEVLSQMGTRPAVSNGSAKMLGVFTRVDDAVNAAREAQVEFARRSVADRKKAVDAVRKICYEQAEQLGREELDETGIGRLDHKIEKLVAAAERIPGVEALRTEAASGSDGIALTEYAPMGVIGAITPVTHSLPTLAGNAINMLAGGNSVVCNPHPSGAKIACKGTHLFNRAIRDAIGIETLICTLSEPTLETAQALFDHKHINMICVTGGPAVARAALRSSKRAVVAGPGNPPVVVDETADLDNAARSIVAGASYDNNLLCIGEKQVFVVESVFDELLSLMEKHNAVRLNGSQLEALTKVAFKAGGDKLTVEGAKLVVAKELIGQDASVLADAAGASVSGDTVLLFAETDERHPFVVHEQMMPFVPFVRVPDVYTAIELAKESEHGFRHTSIIHSRNIDTITYMGRELDTTLFIQNGPSMAGLGLGGEGYLSFSIATPTGEGVTSPMTFTRQRRSVTAGGMRVL